jgi:hypothetical protein
MNIAECRGVLSVMYQEEDVNVLMNKLIQKKMHSQPNQENKHQSREERSFSLRQQQEDQKIIKYQDFVNVIVEFLLHQHLIFLNNFIMIFDEFDQDQDGIISEQEFCHLVNKLNLQEINIQKCLLKLDPLNTKQVVLTNCIKLFS